MKIFTPATSANLGPGFDCLGLALQLYNEMTIELLDAPGFEIEIEGEGADSLPRTTEHVVWKLLQERFAAVGERLKSGLRVHMINRLPLARGLGSSSAVLVAAYGAAAKLLSRDDDLVALGTAVEGHPDNIAPCVLGGLVASAVTDDGVMSRRMEMADCWKIAIAIPEFELKTAKARNRLPSQLGYSDIVFNLSRATLLTHGLAAGDHEVVREATRDKLHEPYRQTLIPGFQGVKKAALDLGASGVFLSGGGPTMASFVDRRRTDPEVVAAAMQRAFEVAGVAARGMALEVDQDGVRFA